VQVPGVPRAPRSPRQHAAWQALPHGNSGAPVTDCPRRQHPAQVRNAGPLARLRCYGLHNTGLPFRYPTDGRHSPSTGGATSRIPRAIDLL